MTRIAIDSAAILRATLVRVREIYLEHRMGYSAELQNTLEKSPTLNKVISSESD